MHQRASSWWYWCPWRECESYSPRVYGRIWECVLTIGSMGNLLCRRSQLIDRACHCHRFEINWVSNTSALLLFIQYDDNTIREFQIKVTLLSSIFPPFRGNLGPMSSFHSLGEMKKHRLLRKNREISQSDAFGMTFIQEVETFFMTMRVTFFILNCNVMLYYG